MMTTTEDFRLLLLVPAKRGVLLPCTTGASIELTLLDVL